MAVQHAWSGRWLRQPFTRLATLVTGLSGPLTGQDRCRWAAARTLAELGELTAQWLEGDIASQPGYYGPVDVDEQDAPGMTAVLVQLNRTGLVTAARPATTAWTTPACTGGSWPR